MRRWPAAAALISLLVLAEACRREEREPRPDPIAPPNPERDLRLSDLRPGQPNAVPPPPLGQHFYVRSMPRYVREDVVPGRSDHMRAKPAESTMPRSTPLPGNVVPPPSEPLR